MLKIQLILQHLNTLTVQTFAKFSIKCEQYEVEAFKNI